MEVTGRIVAVQEQRFRIAIDSGEVYLLTLGNRAHLGPSALTDLQRRGAHVSVEFKGQPNLAGGVAMAVREVAA